MLKIHQPYSTTLKIESKFPSLAQGYAGSPISLTHLLLLSALLRPSQPCQLLGWSHRCFPPLCESAAPSFWKPHHSGQTKAPKREHHSHTKSAPLCLPFLASSRYKSLLVYFLLSTLESNFPKSYPGPSSVLLTWASPMPSTVPITKETLNLCLMKKMNPPSIVPGLSSFWCHHLQVSPWTGLVTHRKANIRSGRR